LRCSVSGTNSTPSHTGDRTATTVKPVTDRIMKLTVAQAARRLLDGPLGARFPASATAPASKAAASVVMPSILQENTPISTIGTPRPIGSERTVIMKLAKRPMAAQSPTLHRNQLGREPFPYLRTRRAAIQTSMIAKFTAHVMFIRLKKGLCSSIYCV